MAPASRARRRDGPSWNFAPSPPSTTSGRSTTSSWRSGATESADDRVAVLMLLVTTRIGGLVVGAFDGGRLVGFVYAAAGHPRRPAVPVVAHDGRAAGVPQQRPRPPPEARTAAAGDGGGPRPDCVDRTTRCRRSNAHLNFAKLGVVAREYHLDAYPGSASPLHAGTATDRFVAEWWLQLGAVRSNAWRQPSGDESAAARARRRAVRQPRRRREAVARSGGPRPVAGRAAARRSRFRRDSPRCSSGTCRSRRRGGRRRARSSPPTCARLRGGRTSSSTGPGCRGT